MATVGGMTITVKDGLVTLADNQGGARNWGWDGKVPLELHGTDRIITTACQVWIDAGSTGTSTLTVTVA